MYNRTMTTQNDIIDIIFLWALWALIGICVCVIVGYIIYRILRNPFQYPYFNRTFDVSRKRNVDIIDYVDRYLCDGANWINLKNYEKDIEQWKHDTKEYLKTCRLKKDGLSNIIRFWMISVPFVSVPSEVKHATDSKTMLRQHIRFPYPIRKCRLIGHGL